MNRNLTLSSSRIVLALAAFIVLSCNDEPKADKRTSSFDLTAAKAAVDSLVIAWTNALKNEDSVGLGNLYTTDAKLMSHGEPAVVGRDNIVKSLGEFIRYGVTGSTFTTVGLWGNDEMLVEEGTAVFSDKKGTVVSRGKYLVVYKKEDGKWKLFRDMYNSDGTPPPK